MVLFSILASTYMYMYIKYYVHVYWGYVQCTLENKLHMYIVYMYMNNHMHSAPQAKKEESREERKKNHTLYMYM